MIDLSTSFNKGRGNLEHNKRNLPYNLSNVDKNRSSNNIALVDEDIHKTFTKLFGPAVREHDEKETRKDRKIVDYYEYQKKQKQKGSKAKKGQPKVLFKEFVIQFGNRKTLDEYGITDKLLIQMYTEYVEDFKKRNPNLYVVGAYIHLDEKTPHLHLDVVPCSPCNRKMRLTNSFDNALETQGYNVKKQRTGYKNWRDDEINSIEMIYKNHGINRFVVGNTNKHNSNSHLDLDSKYTTQVQNLVNEQSKKVQESTEKMQSFKVKKKVGAFKSEEVDVVEKQVLDDVVKENVLVKTENVQLHNALAVKERRITALEKVDLKVENDQLKKSNKTLDQQLVEEQKNHKITKAQLIRAEKDSDKNKKSNKILKKLLEYASKNDLNVEDIGAIKDKYGNYILSDEEYDLLIEINDQNEKERD